MGRSGGSKGIKPLHPLGAEHVSEAEVTYGHPGRASRDHLARENYRGFNRIDLLRKDPPTTRHKVFSGREDGPALLGNLLVPCKTVPSPNGGEIVPTDDRGLP
jgi:hypothetical protein